MAYSQDLLDQIESKLDLVELASSYTKLVREGNVWSGKCPHPDHNDKTASFKIFKKGNDYTWTCFGCHNGKKNPEKGLYGSNALAFIWWILNSNGKKASFRDAVAKAAQIVGVELDSYEKNEINYNNELNNKYRNNLKSNLEAQKYLLNRGLEKDDVLKWEIGYDTSGRITIPLYDMYGKLVSFNKRALTDDTYSKYFIDNHNKYFNRSKYLFGMNYINYQNDYIYITEGCFDVILASKYGLENCVCALGTDFTEDHVKLILQSQLKPVALLDGDSGGEKGVNILVEELSKYELYPDVVFLPNKKDLADISIEKKLALSSYIQSERAPYWYHKVKPCVELLMRQKTQIINNFKDDIYDALRSTQDDKAANAMLKQYLAKELGL